MSTIADDNDGKTVIITGASSGIGKQLAVEYAKKLNTQTLILLGRNGERLSQTATLCKACNQNIDIKTYCFDLLDANQTTKIMQEILLVHTIDIAIANAGVSAGTLGGGESLSQINTLISTNICGVVNFITPIIERSKEVNRPVSIAIISSMAGLIALPSSPTYSASKAFVRFYGNALRSELKNYGIKISVICPGYIKTPMTAVNKFKMPLLMSAEKAALKIIHAIELNTGFLCFPLAMYAVVRLFNLLPYKLQDWIASKLPKKSSLINTKQ